MPSRQGVISRRMSDPTLIVSITGLMALVPAALVPWRQPAERAGLLFWATLAAALAGVGAVLAVKLGAGWDAGFVLALWLSIAATLAIFGLMALLMRPVFRLAALLLPYLLVFALLAVAWDAAQPARPLGPAPVAWLALHVALSLATYALATLAAVAGLGVLLQELALKRRRFDGVSRLLPTVADGERLEFRFLALAEAVLGAGIATGMAVEWFETGNLLIADHKTLLSLAAFAVIAVVLLLTGQGLRGRRAARVVLAAYLLLTLAYPGVKFVTDVLLS